MKLFSEISTRFKIIGLLGLLGVLAVLPTVVRSACVIDGYHVAPTGSDSNAGTEASPFLTLGKAQAMMEGGGGNFKKTYVHAGTYNTSLSLLGPADNGQTWQYNPADGYNSATINAVGLDFVINITASNVIINGLKIANARRVGISIQAGFGGYPAAASNNIIENCEITGMNTAQDAGSLVGAIVGVGNSAGTQILHNYVHDVVSFGIRPGNTNSATGPGNYSNTTVQGNAIINTATNDSDVGAIYFSDKVTNPTSTNVLIDSNYIRDYNGSIKGYAIYLDLASSNTTVKNNIITGSHQTPNGAFAVQVDDGNFINITNNIFDLSDTNLLFFYVNGDQRATASAGQNNTITHNLVLYNVASVPSVNTGNAGTVPWNFYDNAYQNFINLGSSHPQIGSPTFSGNYYANYHTIGSGPWLNTTGNNFKDTTAVQASSDPQISCWAYTIAAGSPVLNSPVSFVPITTAFGPPGFVLPQTGTVPSSPHAC